MMLAKVFVRYCSSKSIFRPVQFKHTVDIAASDVSKSRFTSSKQRKKNSSDYQVISAPLGRKKHFDGEASGLSSDNASFNKHLYKSTSPATSKISGDRQLEEDDDFDDSFDKGMRSNEDQDASSRITKARNTFKNDFYFEGQKSTDFAKPKTKSDKFFRSKDNRRLEDGEKPYRGRKNNADSKSISRTDLDFFVRETADQHESDSLEENEKEFLFGIFPILMALKANKRNIYSIYCKTGLEQSNDNIKEIKRLADERNIDFSPVPSKVIKQMLPAGVVHQNVCCVATPLPLEVVLPEDLKSNLNSKFDSHESSSESVLITDLAHHSSLPENETIENDMDKQVGKRPQLWLVLDHVVDPMNMGALLRSCCYFGVNRVFLTVSCAPMNALVSKASAGAAELLSIGVLPQPTTTLQELRSLGWQVVVTRCSTSSTSYGTEATTDNDSATSLKNVELHQYKPQDRTILVMGNEGNGVSESIEALADASLTIPAVGALGSLLGSLNVSVTTAIILHTITSSHSNIHT